MKRPADKSTHRFLCAIADTRQEECDCTECTAMVGELAEVRLRNGTLNPKLEMVVQHLRVCPECMEEFQALESSLRELG